MDLIERNNLPVLICGGYDHAGPGKAGHEQTELGQALLEQVCQKLGSLSCLLVGVFLVVLGLILNVHLLSMILPRVPVKISTRVLGTIISRVPCLLSVSLELVEFGNKC